MIMMRNKDLQRYQALFVKEWPMAAMQCLLILLFSGFSPNVYSQPAGNEWINKNQAYYKIAIGKDGIYKINYDHLQQAGFPVGSVDPRRIQLFFRGKEQAILVNGQQDARFDTQDYIIFHGQRNDGTLDTELYIPGDAQPHAYYNLFSDTTAYFLTWRLDANNGKRMPSFSENNVNGLSPEAYHLEEKLLLLTSDYSLGRQYPIGSPLNLRNHLSTYDYGEGWTGPRIQKGKSADYTLPASHQYPAGPKPTVEVLLAGRNNLKHHVTLQIGSTTSTLRTLTEVDFDYYDHTLVTQVIEWSDISGGQLVVRVKPDGVDGNADNVSVSYIKLTYPQQTEADQLDSKTFNLPAHNTDKAYLEIHQPPAAPLLLDVTQPDGPTQIGFNTNGDRIEAIVPEASTERKLLLSQVSENITVRPVSFTNIDPAANFLIVSHSSLRQATGSYADPVEAYRSYRASAAGGGYRVLSVDIEQLYNQFSYGEVSPLAIRHLAGYLLQHGNPQYLLLIGKGLTVDHNFYRKDPATATLRDLIPPAGMPGSDDVFTVGLKGSDGVNPAIPTGRINARSAAEVAAYLDKVKEQEGRTLQEDYQVANAREALWRKHLVHLSGGVSLIELKLFARYVELFEDRAVNDFLGGQVSTLSKTTNNTTELINIADEVNKGLSLITFFGHSSTTRTDIEIGYVSNDELGYRNKGKYPTILLNGCNAGNIFSSAFTFGEDWIMTPNRGALNVTAHSAEGLSTVLKTYTIHFYETAFQDSTLIDQSIGKIKVEAGKRFITSYNGTDDEIHVVQSQQMVLQGDPSIALFGRGKPDFEINEDHLLVEALDDDPVTANSDSFAIQLIVRNFGRTTADSLTVSVNRTLNNGQVIAYQPVFYPSVKYEDTLSFIIRADESAIQQAEGFGNNRFEIILDGNDSVPELNENNNRAFIEYFIPLGGTVNLLPYDYAIVNQSTVTLQVQPGNAQEAMQEGTSRGFTFEIDTSSQFDSPLKMQFTTEAVALASWQLLLPVTVDSTVYYWRSKYTELKEGEIDAWTKSSFVYIQESARGWAQLAVDQLKQNEISQLTYEDGQWKFIETSIDIDITTYGADEQNNYPQLLLNDKQFLYTSVGPLVCRDNSINGVAFEKESLRPYLGIPPNGFDDLDPNNCGPLPQVVNTFSNTQVSSNLILEKYIDGVNEGDAVLLFNIGQVTFQSWPASTLAKLQEIGVALEDLVDLQDGEPIIILGRKNATPGTAQVLRADSTSATPVTDQSITLREKVTGRYSSGTISSKRIGPASSWSSLQHRIEEVEADVDDLVLKVTGESLTGHQVVLYENVASTSDIDLSQTDALQYPYLRLEYSIVDRFNFTPPQLKNWIVTYTGVPEGITFMEHDQQLTLEKQEGESGQVSFGFYNIATVDFTDSISIVYTYFNQDNRKSEVDTLRIAPLPAGDTAQFHIPITTIGRVGVNDLRVQVNPRLLREQSYDNNQIFLTDYLTVKGDKTHPMIDVAFDGTYIMNGDIVAPSPLITIEIRDENPYLIKQDTTGINIYLRKLEEEETPTVTSNARMAANTSRIDLSSPQVSWTPATEDQPFKITYQPDLLEDGLYNLRVQATDASGNTSGAQPYEINFEVINASTITHFYPYPNPFSTNTRFVFTLTGTEIPDQLKIQIMTVSGKVVREITQDEIGSVRIGHNISSYAWDGRDEFGDELANGVYLYRVIVLSDGKAIEHRETTADRAFKHGFGKMYILR